MKRFLLTLGVTLLTIVVYAQDPGLPGGDPDAPVPIDGGLLALLAAGLGYGVKKMVNERHSQISFKKKKTP